MTPIRLSSVSIRFKVRGGFRPGDLADWLCAGVLFQSALRFAVVSDTPKTSKGP